MVLIIQPRSVWRWLVNEKYTDSDLCKVSVQMTELTNSSHGTVRAGNRGTGPFCSRYTEGTQHFICLNRQVVVSGGR